MATAPSRTDFVHVTLRNELRSGTYRPGMPIGVKDTAIRLRVSPTPVREALERLVGEGLVMPTGAKAGFQLVRLNVGGLVQAVDLHATLAACAHQRLQSKAAIPPALPLPGDVVAAAEVVFGMVFWERTNAQIAAAAARVAGLLASYRRIEPTLFPDWCAELTALATALAGPRAAGAAAIRAYHRRRVARAADLIAAAEDD